MICRLAEIFFLTFHIWQEAFFGKSLLDSSRKVCLSSEGFSDSESTEFPQGTSQSEPAPQQKDPTDEKRDGVLERGEGLATVLANCEYISILDITMNSKRSTIVKC